MNNISDSKRLLSIVVTLIIMIFGFVSQIQYGLVPLKGQDRSLMNQSTSSLIENSEYIIISQKSGKLITRSVDIFGKIIDSVSLIHIHFIWLICSITLFIFNTRNLYIIQYIHNSDGRKRKIINN